MIKFKTEKELLAYLKRFTDNLVNNTKDSGIFDVEDRFKVFYTKDVKKAMKDTWVKPQ
jgi:hypothetical protein